MVMRDRAAKTEVAAGTGGFRSAEGAMDFALIRSLFSTAKKQGSCNVIDALTCESANLAKSLRLS
jgi:hypothetical protein